MTKKDIETEKVLYCSFCKKSQNEVIKLVAGPGVYVCDDCIKLCNKIIEQDKEDEPEPFCVDLPTPYAIKEFLDQYVISQDEAKKVLAVAVYNHYKRINAKINKDCTAIHKSNVLLIGPTGSGKTLLVQSLAKMLNVPFCIVDATSLTEAGYVGEDSESILQSLLAQADNDLEKAKNGIVYIDEIDKIAKKGDTHNSGRDVSGEGVQQSLLKLLEGSLTPVSPRGNKKYGQPEQVVYLDTKDILFIAGGAFCGLEEILMKKHNKKLLGFNKEIDNKYHFSEKNIEPNDLIAYGFIPEFVGRLPIIATLDEIKENDLIAILSAPKNALIKQYQKLFALDGVDLAFSPDAIKTIAQMALERKTGARGLRSVLEDTMLDIMYEIPLLNEIEGCHITKEVIEKTGKPELIFKEAKN